MSPIILSSQPIKVTLCPGTSKRIENVNIESNSIIETSALFGSVGKDKIFVKLIDTPTKISPVKAAAAPATAT
jgi:hypothetical protein